jgi:hypothetical protein
MVQKGDRLLSTAPANQVVQAQPRSAH